MAAADGADGACGEPGLGEHDRVRPVGVEERLDVRPEGVRSSTPGEAACASAGGSERGGGWVGMVSGCYRMGDSDPKP
jgi:hypothetical protein